MRPSSSVGAALLLLAAIGACGKQGDRPEADLPDARAAATQAVPHYSAVLLDGDSVSLEAQRGSPVLLNIWATWCIPCREEMPLLQKLYEANASRGLRVVGVSVDARGAEDRVRLFRKEFGVTFPIWLDPDERASFIFRAIGVPATYLIDREGRIVWRKLGPIEADDRTMQQALEQALAS
jgi:cytochrome c-type biogenesis protein